MYINHPYVTKIYAFFSDVDKIYLVMEYMEEGSLFTLIKKQKRISEEVTSNCLKEICLGLAEMHDKDIVHRDIKPENVVMTNGVSKLCDFGWAVHCDNNRRQTYCGTLDYVCP
jgi:aurora kinase